MIPFQGELILIEADPECLRSILCQGVDRIDEAVEGLPEEVVRLDLGLGPELLHALPKEFALLRGEVGGFHDKRCVTLGGMRVSLGSGRLPGALSASSFQPLLGAASFW